MEQWKSGCRLSFAYIVGRRFYFPRASKLKILSQRSALVCQGIDFRSEVRLVSDHSHQTQGSSKSMADKMTDKMHSNVHSNSTSSVEQKRTPRKMTHFVLQFKYTLLNFFLL